MKTTFVQKSANTYCALGKSKKSSNLSEGLKFSGVKLSVLLYLILFLIPFATIAKTTVHTIGDSTVADYSPTSYPQTGWGQVLSYFFNPDNVAIDNKAVSGTSSLSFYNSFWTGVKPNIKVGDFVFIQFGINDGVVTAGIHTDPATTFKDYLTKYVNETRALGAYPVLITPQIWNDLKSGTWNAYPAAIRELAVALSVPLVDLDVSSTALVNLVGTAYASTFIYLGLAPGEYPNFPLGKVDNTHFQRMGAIEMAKLVVQGLRNDSSDVNIKALLISNLVPTYKVNFTTNNSTYGQVTRSEYFPAGITLTAKAYPQIGKKFDSWSGDINDTNAISTFVMGTSPKTINGSFSLIANYDYTSLMADFETVSPKAFDCSWGKIPTADAITIVDNPSVEPINTSSKCMKIVQKLSFVSASLSATNFLANLSLSQAFPVVKTDPAHYLHFKCFTNASITKVGVRLTDTSWASCMFYAPSQIPVNKWVDVVIDLNVSGYALQNINRFEYFPDYNYTYNSHTADETTYIDDIKVNNIATPTVVAVTENPTALSNNILFYENNGILTIKGINEKTLASIYDVNGKLLQSNKLVLGLNHLNVSGLMRGEYIVHLKTESGIIVKKFLKQ